MARRLLPILFLAAAQTANAASEADISAYADYAAAFDARQGRPEIPRAQQLEIAACILTAFEAQHGRAGVETLLDLMRTVASGVQFDDPTVVRFTETYGDKYGPIVSRCRTRVLNG